MCVCVCVCMCVCVCICDVCVCVCDVWVVGIYMRAQDGQNNDFTDVFMMIHNRVCGARVLSLAETQLYRAAHWARIAGVTR